MQEVINLVASLKRDINDVRLEISELKKTHVQILNEEWITKEQVMGILRIGTRTFQKLKKQGIILGSKINGLNLYRTSDIEKLLLDNLK